ncbi:hypothetical protein [Streptomyces uncialis]|uniref:hypothetical protein n=1 Tax=Streptomyces uncialis TaxID=1048205 RepID=UPI00379A4217
MDRIYSNRIAGQRRIHVEIAENEIADLLDDLVAPEDASESTERLLAILTAAHADFGEARARDAHEAAL